MHDHDGLDRFDLGAESVRSQAGLFLCPGFRSILLGAGMVRRPSVEVTFVGRGAGGR